MKKYLLSFGVIVAFAIYVALNNQGSAKSISPAAGGSGNLAASAPTAAPAPSPAATSSAAAPSAAYKNGSYTGPVADAYFGPVQVQAVIQGDALADVKILQAPSDTGHSREVSAVALPMLVQEAVQAQSADVNIVSGATQTSQAFAQSLAAALAQAKS